MTHTPLNLNQLIMQLSLIPNINYGGCGISALTMWRWLKANDQLHSDTEVVLLYRNCSDDLIEYNHAVLQQERRDIDVPTHIALYHNGIYIDSTSIFGKQVDINRYDRHQHITHHNSEQVLIECINRPSAYDGNDGPRWNLMFSRHHVHIIDQYIDLHDVVVY
jgi:hypothetical protein